MRDLITAYTLAQQPAILYHVGGLISLAPGEELTWRLSPERWCVGFDAPDGTKGSCPDDARAVQGDKCLDCHNRTAMEVCMRCTGLRCANPARRAGCVFADHYVYLAFYGSATADGAEEIVKVGVTKVERFPTRLLEQGALGGVAICAAGGQEARRIEKLVNDAGWVDRTDILGLLARPRERARLAEPLLREHARRVALRLPGVVWMDEGPFVWVADRYPEPLTMPPRRLAPGRDPLAGTVHGVRGGYLMLTLPAFDDAPSAPRETVAVPLRSLPGHEITPLGDEHAGPAQGALLFV